MQTQDIEFLTEFAAYCRGKPVDEAYRYSSSSNCAVAQFLRDTGRAIQPAVDNIGWGDFAITTAPEADRPLPKGLNKAVRDWPSTFSALADRIDALIPERVGA